MAGRTRRKLSQRAVIFLPSVPLTPSTALALPTLAVLAAFAAPVSMALEAIVEVSPADLFTVLTGHPIA